LSSASRMRPRRPAWTVPIGSPAAALWSWPAHPVRLLDEQARLDLGDHEGGVLGDPLGRKVGRTEGDRDREDAAVTDLALRAHRSAVQLGELADQREADAGALVAARPGAADPVETVEQQRLLLRGDADAGVAHREDGVAVRGEDPHDDPPGGGELDRVGEQVENDLFPHLAVDVDRLGQPRRVDPQLESGPLGGRPEGAGQPRGVVGEVGRPVRGQQPAGLQPGEVEHGVDQLEQPETVAVHGQQAFPLGARHGGVVEQVLQRAQDQRQRGAELVADVGEEVGLCPVERRELGGPLAFLLVRPQVVHGPGDLRGGQLEEVAVAAVEREGAADRDDQRADRCRAAPDRQDERLACGGRRRVGDLAQRHDAGPARGEHGADRRGHFEVVRVVQEQGGERHVRGVLAEHGRGLSDQGSLVRRVGQAGAQRAQRAHPPLAEHPPGGVGDDAEDPADLAELRPDRIVGDVEVGLLEEAVPLQRERVVRGPEGPAGRTDPVEELL